MTSSSEKPKTRDWFNKEYLQDALQSYLSDDSIKVCKYEESPASGKGDNFICILSRITVSYTTKNLQDLQNGSYILKFTLDCSGGAKAAFDSYGAYDHEIRMYDIVFPIFRNILRKNGFTDALVPRSVSVNYTNQSILLEDLKALGYEMYDVRKGFEMDLAKIVLRKLATLHAASAVANAENPDVFKNYDRGMFNKHSRAFDMVFNSNFEHCARTVCTWQGFEEYGEKMLKLLPHFTKCGVETMNAKDHNFNVLIHGDMWCNNAMFKFNDSNEPTDVILFDFQFSCWTSPTIDLHYFFHTSLREEVRNNCIDELVQYYYLNLKETLHKLKFTGKIPSLQEFWMQYIETMFYALYTMTFSQPLMLTEETEGASVESMMKDSETSQKFRDAIYGNKMIKQHLQRWLPVLDRYGILDLC